MVNTIFFKFNHGLREKIKTKILNYMNFSGKKLSGKKDFFWEKISQKNFRG